MTFSLQYLDYRRVFVKRAIDMLGGLMGSLITLVLTPFVALAIKLESKGPVFFEQTRIGKNGRSEMAGTQTTVRGRTEKRTAGAK
jgi:lipopolysaccharide/colanic/teichoic acid biosynthesis glycosyltransferase